MIRQDSYGIVQNIAKETMNYLFSVIVPGISEKEIRDEAEAYMLSHGIESFWYYNVGALVFIGDRTTLSVSGRDYTASDRRVEDNDLVTVDLSPCIENVWGDYARSFIVGEADLIYGIDFENYLHSQLSRITHPDITLHEMYHELNDIINLNGFINLDFNGNLGHTIEKSKDARKYIEHGNMVRMKEIDLFTFEPHVKKSGHDYGFKMENIYYLEGDTLHEL